MRTYNFLEEYPHPWAHLMSSFTGLKVKDPQKYGFQPRTLLIQLTDIYTHLDSPVFVEAVAGDEVKTSNPKLSKSKSSQPF